MSRRAGAIASPSTGAARRGRSATSPTPSCWRTPSASPTRCATTAIGRGDVVGIYLPMIPEVVVAMLACARIGAPHNVVFGGFSAEAVRERMEFSQAKALVTVDGARRKGTHRTDQGPRSTRCSAGVGSMETIFVVRHTGVECEMRDGPRRLVRRGDGVRGAGVPAGADGRRGPALHPLHLGLDREAEGHPPHHRRLPCRRRLHPSLRLRPEAGARRLLVRSRRRLGHGPLLHRLRPARQRSDQRACSRARPTIPTRTSGGRSSSATA